MALFKEHMFQCFFLLINANKESLDLKFIILLVKKKFATIRPDNPLTYTVNRYGCGYRRGGCIAYF